MPGPRSLPTGGVYVWYQVPSVGWDLFCGVSSNGSYTRYTSWKLHPRKVHLLEGTPWKVHPFEGKLEGTPPSGRYTPFWKVHPHSVDI